MHVVQWCSVIVRLPAIVALWCILSVYGAAQCVWRVCGGRAPAPAVGSGQRPGELNRVGLILADADASAPVLCEVVAQAAAVLAASGCRAATVHDTHGTLQRDREALLVALRAEGIESSYSTPRSVLQDWTRVWHGGAATVSDRQHGAGGGAATADRDFLQAQLQAALGASAAAAPDLLLVVGPVLSLAGYAPWQARFCEIQHLGEASGAGARVQGALQRYTRTLQRGGT